MGTLFEDSLALGVLVASIDASKRNSATAAMKTLTKRDPNREDVTSRLNEECKTLH